jgi:hypothetical protein
LASCGLLGVLHNNLALPGVSLQHLTDGRQRHSTILSSLITATNADKDQYQSIAATCRTPNTNNMEEIHMPMGLTLKQVKAE